MKELSFDATVGDSERKFRMKIIVKAFVKSIIAFLIGYAIVYIYFELILRVKEYRTNEVIISTGIPLLFWFITMVISTYPLYKRDKERFENLDNETKEKISKLGRPIILLSIILLILVFLQILITLGFLPIHYYYHFIFFMLFFCLLIAILIFVMKYQKKLKM